MTITTNVFTDIAAWPGIKSLWTESLGYPDLCIAILDGPVDQSHPCFQGANLTKLTTLVSANINNSFMSAHGTHIASIIFGQHGSPVTGIAPHCRGLVVPIFSDDSQNILSQLDLARAIYQAVEEGANVINISAGQLSQTGKADSILEKAVSYCAKKNVIIIAAAGNDACQCVHIPAALPSVLAVGAMNVQGVPIDFSNWGETYKTQGILAPGENILGAIPGGGTAVRSGTSFATAIVSGIVALLLSIQIKQGRDFNVHAVRDAILKSVLPCNQQTTRLDCRRFLAGILNIPGAYKLITTKGFSTMSEQILEESTVVQPSEAGNSVLASSSQIESTELNVLSGADGYQEVDLAMQVSVTQTEQISSIPMNVTFNNPVAPSIVPSQASSPGDCGCGNNNMKPQLVYALGTLGIDFGSEARRDSIQQSMPSGSSIFNNADLLTYLDNNPWETPSVIWTLNLDATPIYAIAPSGPFAGETYTRLRQFMRQQMDETQRVERVSIPGIIAGSTRLMSGQIVPLILPEVRGMYSWATEPLVSSAVQIFVERGLAPEIVDQQREGVREFLNRVYYELRNLGINPEDRALNFSATNAFQASAVFLSALGRQMQLDEISVEKSPVCRPDSDCYDVKLVFFDPENTNRARRIYRFTVDVSDVIPVTVGDVRSWTSS